MSDRIRSKDLSYDDTLPPFLRRLRAANGGGGAQDCRHERPVARPKGVKTDREDDGPTVVTDTGDTITKEEYARLTNTGDGFNDQDEIKISNTSPDSTSNAPPRVDHVAQKISDGIVVKKRKAAKVVGDDDEDEDVPDEKRDSENKTSTKKPKKPKNKAKPIKLAFDQDED